VLCRADVPNRDSDQRQHKDEYDRDGQGGLGNGNVSIAKVKVETLPWKVCHQGQDGDSPSDATYIQNFTPTSYRRKDAPTLWEQLTVGNGLRGN